MSVAATLAPAPPASVQDPIRVMVVDDAVVVRGLVSRWVDEEPGLKIVASLRSGREAVDQLLRHNPDVVVLDIEMPDLDGLSALPLLLEKKRDLVVIMASTLTRRNAEISACGKAGRPIASTAEEMSLMAMSPKAASAFMVPSRRFVSGRLPATAPAWKRRGRPSGNHGVSLTSPRSP